MVWPPISSVFVYGNAHGGCMMWAVNSSVSVRQCTWGKSACGRSSRRCVCTASYGGYSKPSARHALDPYGQHRRLEHKELFTEQACDPDAGVHGEHDAVKAAEPGELPPCEPTRRPVNLKPSIVHPTPQSRKVAGGPLTQACQQMVARLLGSNM